MFKNLRIDIAPSFHKCARTFLIITAVLCMFVKPATAQYTKSKKISIWLGTTSGINLNFYRGSTQKLNRSLISPAAFHYGFDAGPFVSTYAELQSKNSGWGFFLQTGFDSRKGTYKEVIAPCNCAVDLSTNLSYFSFEPNLEYSPSNTQLFFFTGPRIAVNTNRSFSYSQVSNSAEAMEAIPLVIEGKFSEIKNVILSMQVGMGFSIPMTSGRNPTQYILSPFVSFHPYFGQMPRNIESWNITTLRVGVILKYTSSALSFSSNQYRRKP